MAFGKEGWSAPKPLKNPVQVLSKRPDLYPALKERRKAFSLGMAVKNMWTKMEKTIKTGQNSVSFITFGDDTYDTYMSWRLHPWSLT